MSIVSRRAIADPRIRWFPQARFGMFVHFGLYSLLGRGEWVQYHESIPRRTYEKLARRFNPSRFDADDWVTLAQQAGCRYIALTAKHHDGFCLFDSQLTDYKITNTPLGRDLVAEIAQACHRRDMRLVLYYSQPDWHHPNFVHLPGAFKDLAHTPPDQRPDWPAYLAYCHGQVRELCTNYGRIDGIWFDGSHKSEKTWQGRRLYRMIKRLQPTAVVNDRAQCGDFFTPERAMPDDLTGYLFEACQSVARDQWGYDPRSPQFSVPNLVDNLVRIVACGGNFLLNVGPKPDGTIPQVQAERMRAIGRWLRRNGEAVYGTEAGNIETGSADILSTRRGNRAYLFLCRWPDTDSLHVPGITTAVRAARLLGSRSRLSPRKTDKGLDIGGLPPAPPDGLPQVVRLDLPRPLPAPRRLRPLVPPVVPLRRETRIGVDKTVAVGLGVKGNLLRVTPRKPTSEVPSPRPPVAVQPWMMCTEQRLAWRVRAPGAGVYRVRLLLACPRPYQGSTYELAGPRGAARGRVSPTPSFQAYRWQTTGALRLVRGVNRLTLRARHMPYGYLFAYIAGLELRKLRS